MVDVCEAPVQLPLLHIVESDDLYFEEQADVLWFPILRDLDWRAFVNVAAQYYEALWVFNQAKADAREETRLLEQRQEATARALFELRRSPARSRRPRSASARSASPT